MRGCQLTYILLFFQHPSLSPAPPHCSPSPPHLMPGAGALPHPCVGNSRRVVVTPGRCVGGGGPSRCVQVCVCRGGGGHSCCCLEVRNSRCLYCGIGCTPDGDKWGVLWVYCSCLVRLILKLRSCREGAVHHLSACHPLAPHMQPPTHPPTHPPCPLQASRRGPA